MDVTPVSLQMIVPRATEVGQVQHNLNQAASLQQDFEAMREQADAKLKETQVRSKANPEDGSIRHAGIIWISVCEWIKLRQAERGI